MRGGKRIFIIGGYVLILGLELLFFVFQAAPGGARHAGSLSPGNANHAFTFGSPEHVVPVILIISTAVFLFAVMRRPGRAALKIRIRWGLAVLVWLNEIVYQAYLFADGAWSPASSLPIHMCGVTILLLPLLLFLDPGRTKTRLFEFLFFWGTCGALIALLFPDMGGRGFPSIKYFTFFVSHGSILVCLAVLTAAHAHEVSFGSLLRASGLSLAAMAVILAVNHGLALLPPYEPGNYLLLAYPPPGDPVLAAFADWFGPAPLHALGVVGVILAGYAVIFAGFVLLKAGRRLVRPLVRRSTRRE